MPLFSGGSLWTKLGNWGATVARDISRGLTSFGEAIGVLQRGGFDIDSRLAQREVDEWSRVDSQAETLSGVGAGERIPKGLYQQWAPERPPPSNFVYRVHAWGRDQKTGRYTSWDVNVSNPNELTPGEVREIFANRFLAGGDYEGLSEVFTSEVDAAYSAPGYEW